MVCKKNSKTRTKPVIRLGWVAKSCDGYLYTINYEWETLSAVSTECEEVKSRGFYMRIFYGR